MQNYKESLAWIKNWKNPEDNASQWPEQLSRVDLGYTICFASFHDVDLKQWLCRISAKIWILFGLDLMSPGTMDWPLVLEVYYIYFWRMSSKSVS